MRFFNRHGWERTLLLTATAIVAAFAFSCSKKCGDTVYDAKTQFCYNNSVIADKCDGKEYNPETQFCHENSIVEKCNGKEYDLATQFCYKNSVIANKCDDGREYDAETKFCFRNELLDKCGGNEYDPETQFCDTRDNVVYKYVKIDKQIWMAQNLNYKPQNGKSWCYGGDSSNCAQYGRLYDWETAKKVCPKGWHLSFMKDWANLGKAAGGTLTWVDDEVEGGFDVWKGDAGKRLKAKNGWKDGDGTDDYGFSALPGGLRNFNGGFDKVGVYGVWWQNEQTSDFLYYTSMDYNDGNMGFGRGFVSDIKNDGYSVRCVKN